MSMPHQTTSDRSVMPTPARKRNWFPKCREPGALQPPIFRRWKGDEGIEGSCCSSCQGCACLDSSHGSWLRKQPTMPYSACRLCTNRASRHRFPFLIRYGAFTDRFSVSVKAVDGSSSSVDGLPSFRWFSNRYMSVPCPGKACIKTSPPKYCAWSLVSGKPKP